MKDYNRIPIEKLDLKDNPEVISPPYVEEPIYECGTSIVVKGFLPHAKLELDISGNILSDQATYSEPNGHKFDNLVPLIAGQQIRARQIRNNIVSPWSPVVIVKSLKEDFPNGIPRPRINPAPIYVCGARTGVSNLLNGANVWIETNTDGEVGRVNGCSEHQGINVNPEYKKNQQVIAFTELCGDISESTTHDTIPYSGTLPTPSIDDFYEGGEQIRITNVVNGAKFTVERPSQGTISSGRTWGGAHLVNVNPAILNGETFIVKQSLCSGDESDSGKKDSRPCSDLPIAIPLPFQVGDIFIRISNPVPSAIIKIFADSEKIGESSGSIIYLTRPISDGETIYIIQQSGNCNSQYATGVNPSCFFPKFKPCPNSLDLFPVGFYNYSYKDAWYEGDETLDGIVYYPAQIDGNKTPFNKRLRQSGRVPIVFIAHGNHAKYHNPKNRQEESCRKESRDWVKIDNHKGYRYLQYQLARMGIISVSIDFHNYQCTGWYGNILDRADLIMRHIELFIAQNEDGVDFLKNNIDFTNVGFLGHSRGGEAVILAANHSKEFLNVTTTCVISLAPTDAHGIVGARENRQPTKLTPGKYSFMAILPAGDGDVRDNDGLKFYDRQRDFPFKCQLYIDNTNHNYFNREWVNNDVGVPQDASKIISRASHEKILSCYSSAFYRSELLTHNTRGFLINSFVSNNVDYEKVHLTFQYPESETVDNHEQNNGITRNSLNLPTQSSNNSVDEHRFDQTTLGFNSSFYGDTNGMVIEPVRGEVGRFRTSVGNKNYSDENLEVWVRVGEIYDINSISSSIISSSKIGIEDTKGTISWISTNEVMGIPRPYERADSQKTVPNTLRFPIKCFKSKNSLLDLTKITAFLIENANDGRAIAYDSFQVISLDNLKQIS